MVILISSFIFFSIRRQQKKLLKFVEDTKVHLVEILSVGDNSSSQLFVLSRETMFSCHLPNMEDPTKNQQVAGRVRKDLLLQTEDDVV